MVSKKEQNKLDSFVLVEKRLHEAKGLRTFLKELVCQFNEIEPSGISGKFAQEYANIIHEDIQRLINLKSRLWWDTAEGQALVKSLILPLLYSLSQPSYMRQLFVVEQL